MPTQTQGPNSPTVASGWLNSSRILVHDGSYATVNLTIGQTSPLLLAKGFGFSIPSFATIVAIQVSVFRGDIGGASNINNALAQLLKAGVGVGNNVDNSSAWGAPPEVVSYGGDLWGTTWTPADINDPNFGFQLQARNPPGSDASDIAGVDYESISVTYSFGGAGGGVFIGVSTE